MLGGTWGQASLFPASKQCRKSKPPPPLLFLSPPPAGKWPAAPRLCRYAKRRTRPSPLPCPGPPTPVTPCSERQDETSPPPGGSPRRPPPFPTLAPPLPPPSISCRKTHRGDGVKHIIHPPRPPPSSPPFWRRVATPRAKSTSPTCFLPSPALPPRREKETPPLRRVPRSRDGENTRARPPHRPGVAAAPPAPTSPPLPRRLDRLPRRARAPPYRE